VMAILIYRAAFEIVAKLCRPSALLPLILGIS